MFQTQAFTCRILKNSSLLNRGLLLLFQYIQESVYPVPKLKQIWNLRAKRQPHAPDF